MLVNCPNTGQIHNTTNGFCTVLDQHDDKQTTKQSKQYPRDEIRAPFFSSFFIGDVSKKTQL